MRQRMLFVLLIAVFQISARAQNGGLVGWLQARKEKLPTPNMTVQLAGEEMDALGGEHPSLTMTYFLVLPDGSKAKAMCVSPTGKRCIIQPFAAEKRKETPCFYSSVVQGQCFEGESYKAYRSGNDLIVFNGDGASYTSIVGSWEKLQQGQIPVRETSSAQLWTAICNDDTISYSPERSGACSDHHGVKVWRVP